jgi:hypothetical protein
MQAVAKMRIEFCQQIGDGPTELLEKNMKKNESVETMLGSGELRPVFGLSRWRY